MRFKVDENLHPEVRDILRGDGHDALTVRDQDLRGSLDPKLAAICRTEQRVPVTLDVGFSDIRAYPPSDSAGIVVLRIAFLNRQYVNSVIRRRLPTLQTEAITGKLWIVTDSTVRIRG